MTSGGSGEVVNPVFGAWFRISYACIWQSKLGLFIYSVGKNGDCNWIDKHVEGPSLNNACLTKNCLAN